LLPYNYGPIRWIERSAAVIALTIVKALLIDTSATSAAAVQPGGLRPALLEPVGSGRPYRVEELADLELEAVRVAGQRLCRGEHLR
jgi:hypothetical protein